MRKYYSLNGLDKGLTKSFSFIMDLSYFLKFLLNLSGKNIVFEEVKSFKKLLHDLFIYH